MIYASIFANNDVKNYNVNIESGDTNLEWVDEIKYLGIFIEKQRNFDVIIVKAEKVL
jgi:hypothetical protein